jgi:hypothetical protein
MLGQIRGRLWHLRRKDHLIKVLGFAVLLVHWFNPLVWLAFALLGKDMEIELRRTDVGGSGTGSVRAYGASLLSLATERRLALARPLAIGETRPRPNSASVRPPRLLPLRCSAGTACSWPSHPLRKAGLEATR